MKIKTVLYILLAFGACFGCQIGNSDSNSRNELENRRTIESSIDEEENEVANDPNLDEFDASNDIYPDGKYLADVEYYNPNTGTTSNYSLKVKVRNNKVHEIEFDNGGWLDDDHFYPEKLKRGSATIETDKGYEYKIILLEYLY